MRLGTCIAVELLVGAATLGALGAGTAWGVAELRTYLDRSERDAAARDLAAPDGLAPGEAHAAARGRATAPGLPEPAAPAGAGDPADLDPDDPEEAAADAAAEAAAAEDERDLPAWRRGGLDDAAALAPLLTGAVTKVRFNRGGSSLSLRLDLDTGARAAFKPEQIHLQSNPRREIAAYRLDRMLGIDRVPPAAGRTFTVAEIVAAIPPEVRGGGVARLDAEAEPKGGELRGEVSWWIPTIVDATVGGFQIDETDGIVTWRRYLRPGAAIPPRDAAIVRQLSDMVVFDFLIDNIDRWSGNNTKASPDGRVLYFMDNTMGFTPNRRGHRKSHLYLGRVQTFSRRLIGAVRALTAAEVRAAMTTDAAPFDALLTDAELAALMSRRDKLLEYVDGLIAEHGEDQVLAFP